MASTRSGVLGGGSGRAAGLWSDARPGGRRGQRPDTDQAGARRLVARVETAVAQVVAGVETLGAGVGAALFPHDGTGADQLLEAADQRLLGAKRQTEKRDPAHPRRRRAA